MIFPPSNSSAGGDQILLGCHDYTILLVSEGPILVRVWNWAIYFLIDSRNPPCLLQTDALGCLNYSRHKSPSEVYDRSLPILFAMNTDKIVELDIQAQAGEMPLNYSLITGIRTISPFYLDPDPRHHPGLGVARAPFGGATGVPLPLL